MKKLSLAAAVLVLLAGCSRKAPPGSPNILLISLDACRADMLSAYGYPKDTSPFLKELAARGVRFTRAYVNTHGTPPSHATLFSGLYQETHHVYYEKHHLGKVPAHVALLPEILKKNGYTTIGVADGGYVTKAEGFDRGFETFVSSRTLVRTGVDRALELVRRIHPFKKPVFLFFHTYQIHSPYDPPPAYRDMFGPYTSRYVDRGRELLGKITSGSYAPKKEDIELLLGLYAGEIRLTDDELRRLFAELDKLDFFENCLIVVWSDHGEEFGDHGGFLHANKMYEELIHIPLIMAGSRVPKGVERNALVSTVDVAPTILAHAGLKAPSPMEGIDLLGPSAEANRVVFSQYGRQRYAVVKYHWKLIRTTASKSVELYNLRQDPGEKRDVSKAHPDVVEEMLQLLADWKKKHPPFQADAEEGPPMSKERIEELRSLGYLGG